MFSYEAILFNMLAISACLVTIKAIPFKCYFHNDIPDVYCMTKITSLWLQMNASVLSMQHQSHKRNIL